MYIRCDGIMLPTTPPLFVFCLLRKQEGRTYTLLRAAAVYAMRAFPTCATTFYLERGAAHFSLKYNSAPREENLWKEPPVIMSYFISAPRSSPASTTASAQR